MCVCVCVVVLVVVSGRGEGEGLLLLLLLFAVDRWGGVVVVWGGGRENRGGEDWQPPLLITHLSNKLVEFV